MKDGDYITIQGWMLALGLKGNELLAFALIYSFSRDGVSVFKGSAQYIADWCGVSRRNVSRILDKLQDRGLIEKIDRIVNGVRFCDYRVQKCPTIGQNVLPPYDKSSQGDMTKCPTIDIEDNGILNIPKRKIEAATHAQAREDFDFYGSLVALGVKHQTADDWKKVRTAKGANDSATAFRMIQQQISASGKDADYCISIAVLQEWRGFNAEWLHNYEARKQQATDTCGPRTQEQRDAWQYMSEMLEARRNNPLIHPELLTKNQ